MELTSTAFGNGEAIPRRYTCEGDDRSPPLSWSDAPETTQSLVLIADDPDAPDPAAPKRVFLHWLLVNIPAAISALPENVTAAQLPAGTLVGRNDGGRPGYMGPCPPIGRHRYFFKLYALDTTLDQGGSPTRPRVEAAMANHIVASAVLMGTYECHA